MQRGKEFLRSIFRRDDDASALSRRDILAGLGLAGLLAAAPTLLGSSPAEAKPLVKPAEAAAGSSPAPETNTADTGELTDFSAHRRWSSRYGWRRRRWRRRYWRRPYWRRRRYWRRRYWRRRYW